MASKNKKSKSTPLKSILVRRRVFHVNIGNLPALKVKEHLEKFKAEFLASDIPTKSTLDKQFNVVNDFIYIPTKNESRVLAEDNVLFDPNTNYQS